MFDKIKKVFLEEDNSDSQLNVKAMLAELKGSEVSTVEVPETLNTEDLATVNEIYEQFGITNDNSIFKVTDFAKTLPDSLPTDTKRQTLLGVLTVSNLQIENLLDDAQARINSLNAVSEKCFNDTNEKISTNEVEIEELKAKIDALKQENNDCKKNQENQITLINEEIAKINEIVNFINPGK